MSHYQRIGVLGGGQLGRMLAVAGSRLGIGCLVFDPHFDACAAQVTQHLMAPYEDLRSLRLFARSIEAATYEFESVPMAAVRAVAGLVPVLPGPDAVGIAADRAREKELFTRLEIPLAPWRRVDSVEELRFAGEAIGYPLLLKSRTCGYDGRGQTAVPNLESAEEAWQALRRVPCVAEGVVHFDRELSLVAVRGMRGEVAFYPLVENRHERGILRTTLAPAPGVTRALQAQAEAYTRAILEDLDYVGVLTLELFQKGGDLLVNEMAPRVHNSGHWTLEGAVTSQFENHLRAITGMPLGSTDSLGCAAMVNLIGVTPSPEGVCNLAATHLHLYGKMPAPGRKLGHITVTAPDYGTLSDRLEVLRWHLPPEVAPERGSFLPRFGSAGQLVGAGARFGEEKQ